ncbi:MAG: SPOR domain-containing protein [Pseudomonadota bacterium]|nr:SPOR domain-containing protein [Pseudomonadota bacterium]
MDTEYSLDQHVRQNENDSALSGYETGIPALLPAQVRQVELLAHLASYSELLVAVTAPDGGGKTTLAQALAAHREEPEEILCLTAGLTLGLPAVLSAVASHWNMPRLPDDLVSAREAVRSEAEQRLAEGTSLLVIIDDAEQLDAETLNEISHFALLAPQAISFALFGRDGYEAGFRESPAHAPLHVMALEPLSLDDAARLLQQVFAPGQALALSQDDILLIYQQSGGWPGALLRQAEDYLLNNSSGQPAPAAREDEATGSRFPLPHLLAIAAVAAALLMSYFYSGSSTEDAATESTEMLTTLTYPPQQAEPEPAEELVPPVVAVMPDAGAESESEAALTEEPDYNYEAPASSLPQQQKPAETVVTGPLAAAPAVTEKTVPAAEPQRSKAEQVLLAAAADSFVVQLFASYQADSAERFRQQWADKVTGSLYQYETEYKNRPWHVVVAGVFASRAEAQAAVNALPVALRRQSPWIRDVTAVQKVLR